MTVADAGADPTALPGHALEQGRRYGRRVGTYFIVLGVFSIALMIAQIVVMDGLNLDLLGILLLIAGVRLRRKPTSGWRTAGMVICSLYIISALNIPAVLLVLGIDSPWEFKVFHRIHYVNVTWVYVAGLIAGGLLLYLPPLVALAHPATYRAFRGGEGATRQRFRWIWCIVVPPLLIGLGAFLWDSAATARIPEFAKPAAIEARYARQVERVRYLSAKTYYSSEDDEESRIVFSPPEVLSVSVARSRFSRSTLASKPGFDDFRADNFWTRNPKIGQPVVNLGTCKFEDGTTRDAAVYMGAMMDSEGCYTDYSLVFDLDGLRSSAPQESK
jgi:hypothetical protein